MEVIAGAELRVRGELNFSAARFESCAFDNCRAQGGRAVGVELVDCTAWACQLVGVHLEDCLICNLKTARSARGRRAPLFLWGGTTRRVSLVGQIGGIVWNPPRGASLQLGADSAEAQEAHRYYESIDDWALDVSEARFTSVPTLRFGPPGRLVRRDPETQPLISRLGAERALASTGIELGPWRTALRRLAEGAWPDQILLIPALGAARSRREEQLSVLERLRQIGAFAV